MRGFLEKGVFIFGLFLILWGCNTDRIDDSIKITIIDRTRINSKVKIIIYKDLEEVSFVENQIDSTGACVLNFNLPSPTMAILQIGDHFNAEIYLKGGYSLLASPQSEKIFSGTGSEVNNYLSQLNLIVESVKFEGGEYIAQLDIANFYERFDLISSRIRTYHNTYLDSIDIPQELVLLLEKKNEIKLAAIAQEYEFKIYNDSLNAQREALQIGKNPDGFSLPKELRPLEHVLELDSNLLSLGNWDYIYFLQIFLKYRVYSPNYNLKNWTAMESYIPIRTSEVLRTNDYPEWLREYLMADNIKYWLNYYEITPANDSIFDRFKSRYRNSIYTNSLQKIYNEWLSITPGNPAPEFTGVTPEGKRVSLSQLQGKIIYIDLWATWCGPCIKEIPFSEALQNEFINNKNIVFLNISIDQDTLAWKKFLLNEKSWGGYHLNMGDEISSLWNAYKITGIPTYILIDQYGKIVDVKAPPPSDSEIKKQIQKLLSKKI